MLMTFDWFYLHQRDLWFIQFFLLTYSQFEEDVVFMVSKMPAQRQQWDINFINGFIQDNFINGFLQDNFINGFLQDNFINSFLQDNFINGFLQDTFINGFLQDNFINGILQDNFIRKWRLLLIVISQFRSRFLAQRIAIY